MKRALLSLMVLAQVLIGAAAANAYYSGVLTPGNPIAGHPWFVDRERSSWWVAYRSGAPGASVLGSAADNPMGKTFGSWVHDPATEVRNYIDRAHREQPGSIPFLNLARIEGPSCPYSANHPGFSEKQVDSWVNGFARGLGSNLVFVILETDKLTTIRCLPRWARARRFREISYEVHTLHQLDPNSVVYIDAGAANWGKRAPVIARWLRKADVAEAQGFSLNTSHHDWTSREDRFGVAVSRLLGGKHFVVNTNSNGWGPKPHGVTAMSAFYHGGCTPPGEGLGIQPTVNTGVRGLDAYVWSGTPGFESGDCLGHGKGSPYTFYLSEAISLARNANPAPR